MSLFSRLFQPKHYTEPRTGLRFPAQLASLKRLYVRPYTTEGSEGVCIGYGGPAQATVYVYSRAGVVPPDGGESEEVASELQEALAAVRDLEANGLYHKVTEYDAEPEVLGQSPSGLSWGRVAFSAYTQGAVLMSFIFVTGFRNHFLKLRISTGAPDDPCVMAFASAMGDFLAAHAGPATGGAA